MTEDGQDPNCKHEELVIVGKGPKNRRAWFIQCEKCGHPVRRGGRLVGPAHAEKIIVNDTTYEFAGVELKDSNGGDKDLPTYLQADEELRQKEVTVSMAELHTMMYQFDWIEILREAVESRPTSWGVQKGEEYAAVPEWRNAADTLVSPVWKRLFQELYKKSESPSKSAEHGTAGVADRQSHSEDVGEPPKPDPDAWLIPRKIVDSDGRKWGDTVEAQRFPLRKNLDFAEPLFSAGTIQDNFEIIDSWLHNLKDQLRHEGKEDDARRVERIEKEFSERLEVFSGDE